MSSARLVSANRPGDLIRKLIGGRTCPVCGKRVARFMPLPAQVEATARQHGYVHFGKSETFNLREYSCPHCGASDRERLYALFIDGILTRVASGGRAKLLHLAPEPALSTHIRSLDAFEYHTADARMDGVDHRVDLCALPYADATFDAFICSHVLEHIHDDRAALRELRRILRRAGWGILMVPLMTHLADTVEDPTATSEDDRWRLFGQGDHVRLYAKQDFLARIAEAGLTATQLGADHFGLGTYRRSGVARGSVLYVVSHD